MIGRTTFIVCMIGAYVFGFGVGYFAFHPDFAPQEVQEESR